MLTLKYIAENRNEVITKLKVKNFDATQLVDDIIALDQQRKNLKSNSDNAQAEMNTLSKQIGMLFKEGNVSEANAAKSKTSELKDSIKELSTTLAETEEKIHLLLVQLPNLPHVSVPAGNSEDDNEIIKKSGSIPELEQKEPHWDLIKKYDIIDFELGTKLPGAGFPVYKGKGTKLQGV